MGNLSFKVACSHNDTGIEILASIDNQQHQRILVGTNSQTVQFEFDDDTEQPHEIVIEMRGKNESHTKLNSQGEIVEDVIVKLSNILLEDFDIEPLLWDKPVYTHSYNGTQPQADHKFYGPMGCNGTVKIQFSSPSYIWLLEQL